MKLGLDSSNGYKKVAIKILNEDRLKYMQAELDICNQLSDHINIVKLLEYGSGTYKKNNGKKKKVSYIIFELAEGGEVFDYIL